MRLYLVQHAEAEPEAVNPDRPITKNGRNDIERCAIFTSQRSMVSASALYHSGKTRARETAEILADHLMPGRGAIESVGLLPKDDPVIWADRISQLHDDLMLVGHLPHLGRLASHLLCGDPSRGIVEFKNACILCMRRHDSGEWSVQWLILPDLLPRG